MEVESHIAEEKEKCEQEMEDIRMRLQAQATEVHNTWRLLRVERIMISLPLVSTKASIARMQRSVQEKAIQNKIMEKVC